MRTLGKIMRTKFNMERLFPLFVLLLSTACNQLHTTNETSELGSMSPSCLDSVAWESICKEHSIDSIKDRELLTKLQDVKNHFIKPDYILYFKEGPEEIIGCDWYSIRVVYNREIADQTLTGSDPLLGNDEQKRIRNRVLKELMKYQCYEGQIETLKEMENDIPYAESHKDYPLKQTPEMTGPDK
jgi:mRNA-degrading endonuclease YafQ of YafQ-DinJ toxin-antitoxin module